MDWILPLLISSAAIPLTVAILARVLPRRTVYMAAWHLGRRIVTFAEIYTTKHGWEKLHRSAWTILYDLADGLRDGSRRADKSEPTPPSEV